MKRYVCDPRVTPLVYVHSLHALIVPFLFSHSFDFMHGHLHRRLTYRHKHHILSTHHSIHPLYPPCNPLLYPLSHPPRSSRPPPAPLLSLKCDCMNLCPSPRIPGSQRLYKTEKSCRCFSHKPALVSYNWPVGVLPLIGTFLILLSCHYHRQRALAKVLVLLPMSVEIRAGK